MQRLWAPWRIRYILGKKEKGCFLCYGRSPAARRARYVLTESRSAAVLLNKYTYAAAPNMVITTRHVSCGVKNRD
jgi:ATP adenylyltransferase